MYSPSKATFVFALPSASISKSYLPAQPDRSNRLDLIPWFFQTIRPSPLRHCSAQYWASFPFLKAFLLVLSSQKPKISFLSNSHFPIFPWSLSANESSWQYSACQLNSWTLVHLQVFRPSQFPIWPLSSVKPQDLGWWLHTSFWQVLLAPHFRSSLR